MSQHRTPWTFIVCAALSLVTMGIAIAAESWSNVIAQVNVLLWIYVAARWHRKAGKAGRL